MNLSIARCILRVGLTASLVVTGPQRSAARAEEGVPAAESPAFAGTPLGEIPPFPEGTQLIPRVARVAERGRIGGYAMRPSKYGVYYDERNHRPGSKEGIYVRYRKKPYPSFCGAYLVIAGDLSAHATMTFWVKGAKGGEAFEIGMNDVVSNQREDAVMVGSIYRYLPQGVTTQWQQVKIPLEDFFGADLRRVFSVVFNFNETGEGIFWIDEVAFHEEQLVFREDEILSQGHLLVDNFDHADVNLLGRKANAYKRLPSVCRFDRVESPRVGDHGRSLRLSFEKKSTGWCGYYTLLNQIDGSYYDLTLYKEVAFQVRGGKGGETFEVGMADRSWQTIGDSVKADAIEKYLPAGVTTQWQEAVIPLDDFGKLDWTQMGSVVFNFHRPSAGELYIDDLRLIRKSEEDLLEAWDEE